MGNDALIWEEPLRDLLWESHSNALPSRKAGARKGGALGRLSLNCQPSHSQERIRLPSEMSDRELAFLCGLLRRKRPEKVLEVGVAAGGTSAVILKTLNLLGGKARLHSVDLSFRAYRRTECETGYLVAEKLPELRQNWDLRTGGSVDAFVDDIGDGIDFCILDTVHRLPGELLDFLAILPYLKNGAVVVVHDTQLHLIKPEFPTYATCALLSVVAAEKIIVKDSKRNEGVANIAAFIVTEDTRKYIANVFSAFMLPWAYMPSDQILSDVLAGMEKHYPPSHIDFFKRAVNLQCLANGADRKYETDEADEVFLKAEAPQAGHI
ncbi:MAG: class I SAM-dependent methyltransferase [Rhodospirillaceae bacterium]|nr:class I SAM-dependent methyltransferase [Rhodospirillaceae bacterium]